MNLNLFALRYGVRSIALLVILGTALVAGCQPKKPVRVNVTGTITVKGKPLKVGRLIFHGQSGDVWTCQVEDGAFTVTDVAPGEIRVTMATLPNNIGSSDKGGKDGGKGGPLPGMNASESLYSSPEKTPLKYTITEEQHTIEIVIP